MPSRITFRLFIAIFIVTCCLLPTAFAQEPPDKPIARKFDEFGDIDISSKIARLDNLAIQLQNEPQTKAYIMVYYPPRDLPGLAARYLTQMKTYLVYNRGVQGDRVVIVDGGTAPSLVQEFWIAPPGTTPTRRSDAYTTVVPDPTMVRKFDEYYFPKREDFDEIGGYGWDYGFGNSLPAYAEQLHKTPGATAYIIVYPHYYINKQTETVGRRERTVRRVFRDNLAVADEMRRSIIAELTKEHGVPMARIKVVNGGYRRSRTVELWILPAGEHPPIATPNAFPPKKRSHR